MFLLSFNRNAAALFVLLSVVLSLVPQTESQAHDTIVIGGVGSALGTMRMIADAFEKSHAGVKVKLLPSLGSTGGVKGVVTGAIDIGLAGRELNQEEKHQGAVAREYARSPLVFVANESAPVKGLSIQAIVDIYEGKMLNWPDGSRLRLVLRPASDIDTRLVKEISPAVGRAVDRAHSRFGMIIAITNQESDSLVESTSGALGISTMMQVFSEKRSLKVLSLDGVKPGARTLANGSYRPHKRFFLVTRPNPTTSVQLFLRFVQSRAGVQLLEQSGSIPFPHGAGR